MRSPHLTKKELLQILQDENIRLTPLIKAALIQAEKTHGQMKRFNGSPYLEQHIYPMVQDVIDYYSANKMKINEVMICAILMHDVLEDDTDIDQNQFKKKFGDKIFEIVVSVTKPIHAQDVSQKEMFEINSKFWNNIQQSGKYGVIIKLLDKINNNTCDLTILPKYAKKVKRDLDEIEKLYIPYTKENDKYLHTRFVEIAKELKKALKS